MRNAIWLLGLLAASTAWALDPAAPVVREENGAPVEWRDDGLPLAYASTYPYRAAAHRWEADGWRQQTAAEIADRAAARELAAQDAEAAATLPQTSETGYAVLDDAGHWVELIPTGDGLPVIGAQVSNSPLTPEQRAQMKAQRKAAHAALKAQAASAKTDKEKLAVLMKAVFGTTEE